MRTETVRAAIVAVVVTRWTPAGFVVAAGQKKGAGESKPHWFALAGSLVARSPDLFGVPVA
jgi:hypothetical protein